MATYTGLILVGVGHPNDDGLTYSRATPFLAL
jgi:hypothetical protein